jgi:hypothetical protein
MLFSTFLHNYHAKRTVNIQNCYTVQLYGASAVSTSEVYKTTMTALLMGAKNQGNFPTV